MSDVSTHYCRAKAYIAYGNEVLTVTDSAIASQACKSTTNSSEKFDFPENGWEDICKATPSILFDFSNSQIISYFVTRSVTDGKIAADVKSINKSAENLFICCHVKNIQFLEVDKCIYIKAKCLPEMRKDRVYILKVVLKARELDIVYAECGSLAGMGPKGSCKHISALA